jgi:hypothetical protein
VARQQLCAPWGAQGHHPHRIYPAQSAARPQGPLRADARIPQKGAASAPGGLGASPGNSPSPDCNDDGLDGATASSQAAPAPTLAGLVHTLEQLTALEATLHMILEGLKSNVTYVSYLCREYWGTSASKAQVSLERLEWKDRLKRQVHQSCALESLSLAICSSICSGTMQEVSTTIRSRLRQLIYYIHENGLVLLDLVRQRLQYGAQNQWAEYSKNGQLPPGALHNFDILIRVGRYRQLRKGEHVMALRQHNEMIANIARQLCRGASSSASMAKQVSPRRGDMGPGPRSVGSSAYPASSRASTGAAAGVHGHVLAAANEVLASCAPLDRLRPRSIRASMLQYMHFRALLNVDGRDEDCPWPTEDPYVRFEGTEMPLKDPSCGSNRCRR